MCEQTDKISKRIRELEGRLNDKLPDTEREKIQKEIQDLYHRLESPESS